jgi:predicted dinucleotide-binding enzyme
MSQVVVVVGPGSIGQAIARRVSVGNTVLLADLRPENAETAAKVLSTWRQWIGRPRSQASEARHGCAAHPTAGSQGSFG